MQSGRTTGQRILVKNVTGAKYKKVTGSTCEENVLIAYNMFHQELSVSRNKRNVLQFNEKLRKRIYIRKLSYFKFKSAKYQLTRMQKNLIVLLRIVCCWMEA